jgi:hypothetical protein
VESFTNLAEQVARAMAEVDGESWETQLPKARAALVVVWPLVELGFSASMPTISLPGLD